MSARQRMTMRAHVTRNQTTTTNDWNQPDAESHSAHETIACWAWSQVKRQTIDEGKTVVVEDIRALFPVDANLTDQDRLSDIKDRTGTVLFGGVFEIETIQRMHQHLELVLSRVN